MEEESAPILQNDYALREVATLYPPTFEKIELPPIPRRQNRSRLEDELADVKRAILAALDNDELVRLDEQIEEMQRNQPAQHDELARLVDQRDVLLDGLVGDLYEEMESLENALSV
jgi:hypothetical protein